MWFNYIDGSNNGKEVCYYCQKLQSSWYNIDISMYKVISTFDIIIYKRKKYNKIIVWIPICVKCRDVVNASTWFWFVNKHPDKERIINKYTDYYIIKELLKDKWKFWEEPSKY